MEKITFDDIVNQYWKVYEKFYNNLFSQTIQSADFFDQPSELMCRTQAMMMTDNFFAYIAEVGANNDAR